MSKLKILTVPNPILNKKSVSLQNINSNIKEYVSDLKETMNYYSHCVGLAAPQTGENLRIVIIDASKYSKPCENHGEMVLINPVIRSLDEKKVGREGCLSIPDLTANISRATEVEIEAVNFDENYIKFKAEGFEAIVLQHEIDHLDGILFLDRVSSVKTDVFRRKKY
ncbi:peptide deformylase [Elusimicrobiota bacterium]